MDYRIFPPEDILQTMVRLPLSKSVANRALAIAALTPGGLRPVELPDCGDTVAMVNALDCGGEMVDCGEAGSVLRFVTAVIAATPGRMAVIDGAARLRERPVGALVEALRACGASIEYVGEEGHAPLRVAGCRLAGGEISLDASTSSQYASALLMAAPVMEQGLTLHLEGEIVSEPYIGLTIRMMERSGAQVERVDGRTLRVAPGGYRAFIQPAETDWSAAAFWYEIEALTSGFVSFERLDSESAQPDRRVAELFGELGVNTDFEGEDGMPELLASPDLSPRLYYDFSSVPDLVPATVVTCCLLRIPFRFTGLSTLRIKECDRVAALVGEMSRLGVKIDTEGNDTMVWEGHIIPVGEMPRFDVHGDHRMAMALAPVALYVPGIVICDADVVDKSYPGYWDGLRGAGFTVEDVTAGEAGC